MSASRSQESQQVGSVNPELGQVTPLTPDEQKLVSSRRKFLQFTVGGSLAAIGAAFAFPVIAIKGITQYADVVAEGDLVGDTSTGQPIDVTTLALNEGIHAGIAGKPYSNNQNKLEVVRVAENGDVNDFRVYNQICTHLGCNVSPELLNGNIHCACHGSLFNPVEGAEVVGGPAPRPLPELPVTLNESGQLVVAGTYSSQVG